MSESPKQRMRSVCLGLGFGLGDVGVVVVVVVVVGFERPLEDLVDLYGDDGVDEGDSRGLGSAPFAEGGVAMVRRRVASYCAVNRGLRLGGGRWRGLQSASECE